ncbi:MAG: HEAT repeat domain-containing protein [Deltaproteobacteria bacterium]|nr:HEAT repeat domain-containing protein [Deltaproteobacteria bacterium]
MEPAIDPFQPLLRLLDRYRAEVNHLRPPAGEAALAEARQRLGLDLPESLTAFLVRWNGAVLLRGVLRIRGAAELSLARTGSPPVVLFADGPREEDHWAWVPTGRGTVFGRWTGSALVPRSSLFHRWLFGMLAVLEELPKTEEQRLDLLLSHDPQSPFLLLEKAVGLLASGDPDRARPLLLAATRGDPDLAPAWQRLGDSLVASDPAEARRAYVRALSATRFPAPYPGAPLVDTDLLASLGTLQVPGEPPWEPVLASFVEEGVSDVRSEEEGAFLDAAALELGRRLLAQEPREEARARLHALLKRSEAFQLPPLLPEVRLLLAGLDTELGRHDDAEHHLEPLHDAADVSVCARARLALGAVVVEREEPWAEEILDEALGLGLSPSDRARVHLLLAERHRYCGRPGPAAQSLAQAEPLSAGLPSFLARVCLVRGDLALDAGRIEEALAAWQAAEVHARESADRELRLRAAVRVGDAALARGDSLVARDAWSQAARGYRALCLPLREARVQMRLGRWGDREALASARATFQAADLAAGVADADAALGDPSASLGWILERATEHAHRRGNALRQRAPLTRADADLPERRLGTLQAVVGTADKSVVKVLASFLERAWEALHVATVRGADPRLPEYVAGVDLLAHHRAHEAAAVLLDHLGRRYIAGPPGNALKAALARSPNAALATGLLELVSNPGEPDVVARAVEVLGWRREPEAVAPLRTLLGGAAPELVRREAAVALGRIGADQAREDLLAALETPEVAEEAAVALLLLGDRRGLDHHAQALARGDTTRGGSPGEIVGRYGDPTYLLLLKAAAGREEALACGALLGLGFLGDLRAVEFLVDGTARPESRVVTIANTALEFLTGHAEGSPDAPDLHRNWKHWWEENREAFSPGLRYREGRVLDPGILVDRLAHDDPVVRRRAYDELVITTGVRLPFDVEGAWRVQVHHRTAWERWWREVRDAYPRGRWTFHGDVTG